MAEVANLIRPTAPSALVIEFTGKITKVYKVKEHMRTVVRLAAADEYATPNQVEVRSDFAIGAVGAVVTVRATLGGYGKPDSRPNANGEIYQNGAINTLDAI